MILDYAERLGLESPQAGAVRTSLGALLAATDDKELFPEAVADGKEPKTEVRAARLLDRLWWEFLQGKYDKVSDGRALAELALQRRPELLAPLVSIVKRLAT
jgi:hypothetical protein